MARGSPARLLTGPTGSGKTERMVELFLSPADGFAGEGVLVLLPDFGAAEEFRRRLLARKKSAAFVDDGITTFEDLSRRLLRLPRERIASPEEESLLLRSLVPRFPDPLRRRAESPHFRTALLGWIAELREAGIGGAEVRALLSALPEKEGRLESLADLLDLFSASEGEAGFFVGGELPARAASRLGEGKARLPEVRLLLVDGFHRFSPSRLLLLGELVKRAAETWITLPSPDEDPLWMEETVRRGISALAETIGITEESLPGRSDPLPPALFGGANREEEIERIAREIRIACLEEGRVPSDFLVLFRDLGPYATVLPAVFRRFSIPFHGRLQIEAPSTAAGRSLLDLLRLVREGVDGERVKPLIQNRMFGVDPDLADRVAAATAGLPPAGEEGKWTERVRALDPGFTSERLEPLLSLRAELLRSSGGALIGDLRRWWLEWIAPSLRPDLFPVEEREREGEAVRRIAGLLEKIATAIDRFPELAGGEAGEVLGMVEEEIRRARVTYTAGWPGGVRVDDFRHGQNYRAPVLFLAGLDATHCPRPYHPGSFWNETDRERLNGTGQFRVPDRVDHAAEERFLFRRAYRRGEEKVFLSSPSFDKEGSPAPISPFLQEVIGEFGERADRSRGGVERFATSRSVVETTDILPFLASRADPAEADRGGVGLAALLASECLGEPPTSPKSFRDPVRLGESPFFRAWLEAKKEYSVTEIEEFAACPYRYLSRNLFSLREREEPPATALAATDEGELLHEALERSLRDGRDVTETVEELLAEALSGFPERVGHRLAVGLLLDGLLALLRDDEAFRAKYRWTPKEFEYRFGLAEKRPLEIAPGLFLRGRIDRIDAAPPFFGLVVDYKRSAPGKKKLEKRLEAAETLALPLYLSALRTILGAAPAGAFLLGATNDRRTGFFNSDLAGEGIVPEARSAGHLLPLDGEVFEQLLEDGVQRVEELARRIAGGEFPVDPADEDLCARLECPYRDLCRIVLASKEGEE